MQLFIYGRMIRLIGVRDIILEEWCDWIIFGLWREWSDHTHQLWLSVELKKPSKPGYVNSAMYLAKKVKIKNKYKSYSATWVLIWNVIFGSFCTNFATWMTPFLYQFCNLNDVTSWFWRYLDCNRDTFDLNDLDHISIRIWAQPNSSTGFFFLKSPINLSLKPNFLFKGKQTSWEK